MKANKYRAVWIREPSHHHVKSDVHEWKEGKENWEEKYSHFNKILLSLSPEQMLPIRGVLGQVEMGQI